MAEPILTQEDLEAIADIERDKALEIIADVEAMAAMAASCINDPEFREDETLVAAAKAIVRQAALRRNEAGSGALSQVGAGSFQQSVDTRTPTRGLLWPSAIAQLRDVCGQVKDRKSVV